MTSQADSASVEPSPEEPWAQFPANLDYVDAVSENVLDLTGLVQRVGRNLCSTEESFIENLQFENGTRNERACPCATGGSMSLRMIPLAAGQQSKTDTMSATAEDLRELMHEYQISPNVLHLLFEGHDLGSKSQRVDGQVIRTETWFSLPYPNKRGDSGTSHQIRPVVWFDSRHELPDTRFVLFMVPSDLLANLRHLEVASQRQCILSYELITSLFETVIGKWSVEYQFHEVMLLVFKLTAYGSDRSTSELLANLQNLDGAIDEIYENITAVESIGVLIEFLFSHPWDLNTPQCPYHKPVFLEKLTEHKQRIRILRSKMSLLLGKMRSLKESARATIVAASRESALSAQTALREVASSAQAGNDALAKLSESVGEGLKIVKLLVYATLFGISWNVLASVYAKLLQGMRQVQYSTVIVLLVIASVVLWVHQQPIQVKSAHSWIKARFYHIEDLQTGMDGTEDGGQNETGPAPDERRASEDEKQRILEALRAIAHSAR